MKCNTLNCYKSTTDNKTEKNGRNTTCKKKNTLKHIVGKKK